MITRVAIIYNFNDADWHGGRNYFESLILALNTTNQLRNKIIILTGHDTKTTIINSFPDIEVHKSAMLDRLHPLWFFRQVTLKLFGRDLLLSSWMNGLNIHVITHASNIGTPKGIKTISWLRDFQFMHLPEYWDKRIIKKTKKWYQAACENSDALIVSSYDALNDLKLFYANKQLPPVHVLQFTSKPVDFGTITSRDSIIEKYQLPIKYLYLPNQFWTAKNHVLVVKALEICKQRQENITVVCTGKTHDVRNPHHFSQLNKQIKKAGLEQSFRILDLIPYADTVALMYHAHAFINPSKFEGWSTTVEEAKTHGKKLILSDISIHREQAKELNDSVIFCPVDNEYFLAKTLTEVINEKSVKHKNEYLKTTFNKKQKSYGHKFLDILNSVSKS